MIKKIKQAIYWFDLKGLFVLSAFLIVFIPLFPKIPIFDVLPGYIVRARPEDFLIFITALIWIKDAIKKRFNFKSTYFWLVIAYAISGITSIFFATFLLQSIPSQLLHIGKSTLHLFRYLEYFALFFFTYSSVKTRKQLKIVLALLSFTVLSIVIYGFGQEFFHFPLYSTMNREYSKGVTLYLQEGARPQSTFAGHYDLAAYLVIVLPIIYSLSLNTLKINLKNLKKSLKEKTNYLSAFLQLTHVLGAWMLVISGSKTALLAYLFGIFIVTLYYLKKLGNLKKQIKWGSIAIIFATSALAIFLNFFAPATKNQVFSLIKNITHVVPNDPNAKPEDLVGDGVIFKQITIKDEFGNEIKKWIQEQSTWSSNALKYGLSMGIRLDSLWPNALKGFANNPLFGNGYATLAVIDSPGAYSNADSTDNNFLRTLGETGIIGFITFYGLIFVIIFELFKKKNQSSIIIALKTGFLGGTIGLLFNATYIDVFAASKVAYTFWALAGITLSASKVDQLETVNKIINHLKKHWPIYTNLILILFILHRNPIHKFTQIKDLNVPDSQIESLTTAKCYLDTGFFSVCNRNGQILRGNINLYSILLVPIYKIFKNPLMFYLLNLILLITITLILYFGLPKLIYRFVKNKPKQILIFTSLALYTILLAGVQYTNRPISSIELFIFLFFIPLLISIYTTFIHNIRFRLAYFTQISAILIFLLLLINNDFGKNFSNQFRNKQISDKQIILDYANVHFDTSRYLNRKNDFYLISTLNPYYIDLFSNGNYGSLPLSEKQPYFNQSEKVYNFVRSNEPLLEQYNNLIHNTTLYATDYGTKYNQDYLQSFLTLKNKFDLTYVAIGCDDNCSLFKVEEQKLKVSPEPISINSFTLPLNTLNSKYSFSVISNRFEPKTEFDTNTTKNYSDTKFASFLNNKISNGDSFLILTGDATHVNSQQSKNIFNQFFNRMPILYNAGNYDQNQEKAFPSSGTYFYTDSEMFIFLNLADDSTISSDQQRFLYNTLLKLEKLPNIQNVFVISHNLDWQNKSNPNNFIFELEKKLAQFPDKNKYIISSFHSALNNPNELRLELTAKHITDENTKTQYLASYIRDWNNDTFFEITVNADNTVTVNYKVKGENF